MLQKPPDDPGYAFPGGHVTLGETNAQTLAREFREEIGAQINVNALAWVGELFFPWGTRRCHQICLYYYVTLSDETSIPLSGSFHGMETLESEVSRMDFVWVRLEQLAEVELYPEQAKAFLKRGSRDVEYFIYRESES